MRAPIVLAWLSLAAPTLVMADTYVQGYYKKDGTYVAPHHRTDPDNKLNNNYSSQGQVNPYTGKEGTQRNEYSSPPAHQHSSPVYPSQQQQTHTPYTPYGQQPQQQNKNPYGW